MNLAAELAAARQSGSLTHLERVDLACRLAKQLEKAGEYEAACEALDEVWPNRHAPPLLEGVDELLAGEVLLRVGALTGWLNSADQNEGSQGGAKDLITRSIAIFEQVGQPVKIAEARADLALCYWREGSFDEARISLTAALKLLGNEDCDLKAVVLIRAGMVEQYDRQLNQALRYYNQSLPLVEQSADSALKGAFHNQLANLYESLCISEINDEFIDRALIEYAAASFHFEQAGHNRYQACVDLNLGYLFYTVGKFPEAHKHLNRAGQLFRDLADEVHLAQVNDTRARTLLGERRFHEAERFARLAVKTLEKGGEQALLAEALNTHGVVVARMGRYSRARDLLDRAIHIAETAGDLEGAGRAKLSIIEELKEQTTPRELVSIYRSAADLLKRSQDPSSNKRLIACGCKVINSIGVPDEVPEDTEEQNWDGFSFKQEIRKCERMLLESALRDAGGSVTRAARLLGFRHHQSLISLINTRHKSLLKTRSAVRKRRRPIVAPIKPRKKKPITVAPAPTLAKVSILHVEDSRLIADVLNDLLTAEHWGIELCNDGDTALRRLTDKDHYDLVLVDNELPGLSGLELVQRTRRITHRRRTPIVMLSGTDCETEAWRAGVDAFLRKPDDIDQVAATIARLLKVEVKHA